MISSFTALDARDSTAARAGSIPLAPDLQERLWQHARIACAHMSDLFSGLATTGQDGLRGQ
ncbi:hypothetical protein XH98_21580 [Bradyrhizobium sp. CCBAU 51745]|nr:hypothetical protein [Bradyrhizobium sp. CCBAU 51745]